MKIGMSQWKMLRGTKRPAQKRALSLATRLQEAQRRLGHVLPMDSDHGVRNGVQKAFCPVRLYEAEKPRQHDDKLADEEARPHPEHDDVEQN